MGFWRLCVASVVYPTALVVLLLATAVTYVHFLDDQVGDASPSLWNPHKLISLDGLRFTEVNTNGVRLSVIEAGQRTASKLVVLLHGFPETALLSWHEQIPALVAAGYFVVAPDQRGYNQSEKPEPVEAYHRDCLAADVRGLIQHYGFSKAAVIGHDWGGAVAWWLAQTSPSIIEKLVILNVPHDKAFSQHLRSSLAQLRKSWYIFYFQLPALPEEKLGRSNFTIFSAQIAKTGIPGKTFAADSPSRLFQAWNESGALTGMLNWYRAAIRYSGRGAGVDPTIRVPTHVIWGKQDTALDWEMVGMSLAFCAPKMCTATLIEEATHWVQHDEPEKVSRAIISFLQA